MPTNPIRFIEPGKPLSGVLCRGNLAFDILVRPVTEPAWGGSTWVETIEQSIGGNGANTSYALAKLGTLVRLVGTIGSDEFGDRVLRVLESVNVDVSHVARSSLLSPATIALVNSNGARALLHRPGASREAVAKELELTPELISGCDRFHLANPYSTPGVQPFAAPLLQQAREAGLKTSIDTGWDAQGRWMATLAPCLPHTDLLFVNEDEARHLTGESDPQEAVGIFREHGARDIVIKMGPRGCLVFAETEVYPVTGFQVDAMDTTGAGDCFVGGFLAALQRAYTYIQAAHFANAVGALSVQKMGSVAGLLSFSETMQWIRNRNDRLE